SAWDARGAGTRGRRRRPSLLRLPVPGGRPAGGIGARGPARQRDAASAAAFADVLARAKNLEARLAGGGLVGNNLGAQLDAARTDAAYAQLLFLFLGLPGAVLAALLTGVIAASGRDRRRREQALLRSRGASPRHVARL